MSKPAPQAIFPRLARNLDMLFRYAFLFSFEVIEATGNDWGKDGIWLEYGPFAHQTSMPSDPNQTLSHMRTIENKGISEWMKSWVNVCLDMSKACWGLQHQLASDKLAKSLPIWARLERDDNFSQESERLWGNDQCMQRLATAASSSGVFVAWDCCHLQAFYRD